MYFYILLQFTLALAIILIEIISLIISIISSPNTLFTKRSCSPAVSFLFCYFLSYKPLFCKRAKSVVEIHVILHPVIAVGLSCIVIHVLHTIDRDVLGMDAHSPAVLFE